MTPPSPAPSGRTADASGGRRGGRAAGRGARRSARRRMPSAGRCPPPGRRLSPARRPGRPLASGRRAARPVRRRGVPPLGGALCPRLGHQLQGLLLGQLLALAVPGPRARDAAHRPAPGLDAHAAAGRARLGERLLVQREVAVGESLAGVEEAVAAAPLDQLALAALRAGHAGTDPLRRLLLDVAALGVPVTADERAVPSDALDERAGRVTALLDALRAGLAGGLRLRALGAVHLARVRALRIVRA